ncbi:MAG: phosphoribosyltransferase family protein [Acidimicrobiia bacterium]
MRDRLIEIVRRGLAQLAEPVQLASGDMSSYFVDCKKALAAGADLKLAGQALTELAARLDVSFDAVGGLTMGADALAHAVAIHTGSEWFAVRKKEKDRGTRRRIEGAELGPNRRVLLVDDVVTRAGSILDALLAIKETGAQVVAAVALVDRGVAGEKKFAEAGIPYETVLTYEDLGIPPVGSE